MDGELIIDALFDFLVVIEDLIVNNFDSEIGRSIEVAGLEDLAVGSFA